MLKYPIPAELYYNQLQQKAFYSVFKSWPIEPSNNQGPYSNGQLITIFLTALTDGVLDPYRTNIQITVQCDKQTLPVGLLQVDNSAQSFIQQLVVTSKNVEVQRILEYGVLAAYLNDIGIPQLFAQGREQQGYGFNNVQNYSNMYNLPQSIGLASFGMGVSGSQSAIGRNSTIFPTIPSKNMNMVGFGSQQVPVSLLNSAFKGHLSWANPAWFTSQMDQVWWFYRAQGQPVDCNDSAQVASFKTYGYVNNIRAQYLSAHSNNDYPDSTSSLAKHEVRLNLGNVGDVQWPPFFTNETIYQTYIPTSLPNYMAVQTSNGKTNSVFSTQNITSLSGFSSLMSPAFSKGVRQPFISPTVPQCQIQNGVILPAKVPVSTRTFKFPLISSVLGILIPQNQFMLIPLKTLNDTYIELTLDKYAMFTSGFNDVSEFDHVGMGLMQQRAFRITKVTYNLHTYQFYSPQIDEYLRVNINSGIAINTHYWQMANTYNIQPQTVANSYIVACNQQALHEVLALFVSLDYQKNTFCRKHFRLSNNLTSFQLRINMQYYPSQPLAGNGGNPVQLDNTGDNSIFLDQIYYSLGHKFSNVYAPPRINAYNFAINERCYNPYNVNTMYDGSMVNNPNFNWPAGSVNYDTALGMANIHENRYVGRAAYLFSFQPYSHSKQFIAGLDCRGGKQFEAIFTAGPQNFYPRNQTLYFFTKSSNIIEYSKNGIVNINK